MTANRSGALKTPCDLTTVLDESSQGNHKDFAAKAYCAPIAGGGSCAVCAQMIRVDNGFGQALPAQAMLSGRWRVRGPRRDSVHPIISAHAHSTHPAATLPVRAGRVVIAAAYRSGGALGLALEELGHGAVFEDLPNSLCQ